MKVKMLKTSAGTKGVVRVGSTIEVSTHEGQLLIGAGYATKVSVEQTKEEKAMEVEPPKVEVPKAEIKKQGK